MPLQRKLGVALGIPVLFHISAIPLLALVFASLGLWWFPYYVEGDGWLHWGLAALGAIGFFASLVLHELAHGLVARHYHMHPRRITLFALGAVVELASEPVTARSEFFMALAGPILSLALGLVLAVLFFGLGGGALAHYLMLVNLALFAFNLIPAFPMDGGRVLRALLWKFAGLWTATKFAAYLGQALGVIMVVGGAWAVLSQQLYSGGWWALLGLFVIHAAGLTWRDMRKSHRQSIIGQIMRPAILVREFDHMDQAWGSAVVINSQGHAVGMLFKSGDNFTLTPAITIPEGRSLNEAQSLLLAKQQSVLVVTRWGKPVGQVNITDILEAAAS